MADQNGSKPAGWFEKFISELAKLLKEPPYLVFLFIGVVFVIVSLITKESIDKTWAFFLYSSAGVIWRYAEKDIESGLGECIRSENDKRSWHSFVIIIYHAGNIVLFYSLLKLLRML